MYGAWGGSDRRWGKKNRKKRREIATFRHDAGGEVNDITCQKHVVRGGDFSRRGGGVLHFERAWVL
jgi:hypothetical protein